MNDTRYSLSLSKTQLICVSDALEEYFRLRLGQVGDLAMDLAGQGVDFSRDNPRHEEIFNDYIHRKEAAETVLKTAVTVAFGTYNYQPAPKLEGDARVCEDIWQVIRHQLWLDNPNRNEWDVASRPLLKVSDEPPAKIKKEVG